MAEIETGPISRDVVMLLQQRLGGFDERAAVKAYCILAAVLAEVLGKIPEAVADELIRDLSHETYDGSRRFRALNEDFEAKLAALVASPVGSA